MSIKTLILKCSCASKCFVTQIYLLLSLAFQRYFLFLSSWDEENPQKHVPLPWTPQGYLPSGKAFTDKWLLPLCSPAVPAPAVLPLCSA